jgi:hypothetical protein
MDRIANKSFSSLLLFVAVLGVAGGLWADEESLPLEPEIEVPDSILRAPEFTLKDQWRKPHVFRWPAETVYVVGIGDRYSGHLAEHWYREGKKRFGDRVPMIAIAALEDLPVLWKPWLGLVLRRHVEDPVHLDWKNEVVTGFDYRPRELNLYVVAPEGEVILRLFGKVNDKKLDRLAEALAPYLPEGEEEPADANSSPTPE